MAGNKVVEGAGRGSGQNKLGQMQAANSRVEGKPGQITGTGIRCRQTGIHRNAVEQTALGLGTN